MKNNMNILSLFLTSMLLVVSFSLFNMSSERIKLLNKYNESMKRNISLEIEKKELKEKIKGLEFEKISGIKSDELKEPIGLYIEKEDKIMHGDNILNCSEGGTEGGESCGYTKEEYEQMLKELKGNE